MADYEIIIRNETSDDDASPIAGSGAKPKKTSGGEASSAKNIAKGIVAVEGYVKPFVDKLLTNRIQTVSIRTGAEELQERLSFAYSVGQQAYGIVKSTAVGAAVGRLPGALIGMLFGLLNTAISYAQKAQQISYQRTVENIGLNYLNVRAGGSVASYSQSRLTDQ